MTGFPMYSKSSHVYKSWTLDNSSFAVINIIWNIKICVLLRYGRI